MNRNNQRDNKRKFGSNIFSEDIFYALDFFETLEDFYKKSPYLECAPDVTSKNDDLFFDYSRCSEKTKLQVKNIFDNLTKGSIFTVEDGSYRDENIGVDDIYFSGDYQFLEFIDSNYTVKAKKPSSVTLSSRIQKYLKENFVLIPQLSVTSLTTSTKKYGVINYFGSGAETSFYHSGIEIGDSVSFQGTNNNDKEFLVLERYQDQNEREILIFSNETPTVTENLIGSPVYVKSYETFNRDGEHWHWEPEEWLDEPPIEIFPDPSGPEVPPDGDPINRCPSCSGICWLCLMEAIRLSETNSYDRDNLGCNAPQTGCNYGSGCDCGPYQIDIGDYIHDICQSPGPCSNPDGQGGGTGYDPECCAVCQPGFEDLICNGCPSSPAGYPEMDFCCDEVKNRSLQLIYCYHRRYGRGNGTNCECKGTYENPYTYRKRNGGYVFEKKKCCTCKDIARRHNRGPSGPCKKRSSNESWYKKPYGVKWWMDRLCPACSDLEDGEYPPNFEDVFCPLIIPDIPGDPGAIPGPPNPWWTVPCEQDIDGRDLTKGAELQSDTANSNVPREFNPRTGIENYDITRESEVSVETVEEQTPRSEPTEPYAIDGFYPLYTTTEAAREASPTPNRRRPGEKTVGYHEHTLRDRTYYMPNGLVLGKTQFHGDYPYQWDSNGTGLPFYLNPSETPSSTSTTPSASTTTSTPSTPSPPSAPSSSPPSGGGGGGSYGY